MTDQEKALAKQLLGDDYTPPAAEPNSEEGKEGQPANSGAAAAPQSETNPAPANPAPAAPAVEAELSEEAVLAWLKKKNPTIESLSSILPQEDPAEAEAKREANKLSYGLSNGKVSKKEYEQYVTDKSNKEAVVYAEFLASERQDNPEAEEDEIRDAFMEHYGLTADKNSAKYKRGEKALEREAESILRARHAKVYNLDGEYDAFERNNASEAERQAKILSETPRYKADVEAAIESLKSHKIQMADGEDFVYEFPKEYIDVLKGHYFNPEYVASLIEQGLSKEAIAETVTMTAIRENQSQILKDYGEKILLKHQAGARGIGPVQLGTSEEDKTLTEEQKASIAATKRALGLS